MPCRPALQAAHPQNFIWISDNLLNEAFNRFLRVSNVHNEKHAESRRYGSNVPGPLESHRRLAKRRMGMSAVGAGVQGGGAEFGALFGFGGHGATQFDVTKLLWKPPGKEQVKREEHWLFPKSERKREMPVWDGQVEAVTEAQRDLEAESKTAFEKLLAANAHLNSVGTDDMKPFVAFLESAENETAAHNTIRLAEWLTARPTAKSAFHILISLVLDKASLRTIDDSEICRLLVSFITLQKIDLRILPGLLDMLPVNALENVCAATTEMLCNYTHSGKGNIDVLPPQLHLWLSTLRDCTSLGKEHDRSPVWATVYRVLAVRVESPAAMSDHLSRLNDVELTRVLLQHWVPKINQTTAGRQSEILSRTAHKRIAFPKFRTEAEDLLSEFDSGKPASQRRSLSQSIPMLDMLQILQKHSIQYARLTHDVFTIRMATHSFHEAPSLFVLFRALTQHPTLGVPAGLPERVVSHLLAGQSEERVTLAFRVFDMAKTVPLSKCPSLPLEMARSNSIHSAKIWSVLQRQTAEDVVPLPIRKPSPTKWNGLFSAHVELVHLVAFTFARSPHIRPRVAFRRVWECYRFLRDRGAPVNSIMTRAMFTAGVVRYLKGYRIPPAELFKYVLDHVREIEGDDVADRLEESSWELRQKVLPNILERRRAVERARRDIQSVLESLSGSDEQVRAATWHPQNWSRNSNQDVVKRETSEKDRDAALGPLPLPHSSSAAESHRDPIVESSRMSEAEDKHYMNLGDDLSLESTSKDPEVLKMGYSPMVLSEVEYDVGLDESSESKAAAVGERSRLGCVTSSRTSVRIATAVTSSVKETATATATGITSYSPMAQVPVGVEGKFDKVSKLETPDTDTTTMSAPANEVDGDQRSHAVLSPTSKLGLVPETTHIGIKMSPATDDLSYSNIQRAEAESPWKVSESVKTAEIDDVNLANACEGGQKAGTLPFGKNRTDSLVVRRQGAHALPWPQKKAKSRSVKEDEDRLEKRRKHREMYGELVKAKKAEKAEKAKQERIRAHQMHAEIDRERLKAFHERAQAKRERTGTDHAY